MNTASPKIAVFSRQPVSTLTIVTTATLFASGIFFLAIWLLVASDVLALLILSLVQMLVAALILLGLRWLPALATLVSGIIFVVLSSVPYISYHLTKPKDTFLLFIIVVLILVCSFTSFASGIAAIIQNYSRRERRTPRWLAAALTCMLGIVFGAALIGAMSPVTTTARSTTTNGVPTVHLGPGNFEQSSIMLQKGSKLLLVDDGNFTHIIANGTWSNGQPQPAQEPGAPIVNNVQLNGNSTTIGPFTTAGTYHLYCSVHQGMILTIVVQ